MAVTRQALLAAGNERAWARIDEQERGAVVPSTDTPVETLLRSGIALSEQAFMLLNAIERSDDGRSAPRT